MGSNIEREHEIRDMIVNYGVGISWGEAITAGAPNTPAGHEIFNLGEQFTPPFDSVRAETIVLVRFSIATPPMEILGFAQGKSWVVISPWELWSIGENHRRLYVELGLRRMEIVSPEYCVAQRRVGGEVETDTSLVSLWLSPERATAHIMPYGVELPAAFWWAFRVN